MNDDKKRLNDEIYTEIYTVLTGYETNDPLDAAVEWLDEFYHLLVKIQNNWEELTGEQG
jgi:hypothetical protein